MVSLLSACGGGDGGGGSSTNGSGGSGSGDSATYTVGGIISGLSASGLVLADNGSDHLSVSSGATSFTFANALQSGADYAVTVATQPTGEICAVASGTGTAMANVTSVTISCKTLYAVGGKISGLSASGLVLTDNGSDDLSVASGATSFTFATKLASGATYNVAVATQPTGATCAVASGTGTVTGAVSSVTVTCSADTYAVSGTISGLSNSGLKLQDYTGGQILSVAANATSFKFTQPVSYGTDVDVAVATQPFWESCTAGSSNFSGHINSDVSSDTFACAAAAASGSAATTAIAFSSPAGVAVDSSGDVYVADSGSSRILEIAPTGAVTVLLGSGNGLSGPEGVAVDTSGKIVYVANTNDNEILEYSGGTLTQLARAYTFNQPAGVAVDSSGNVYVADTGNNAVEEISISGTVTSLGTSYTFKAPTGIAVDSSGNVYVASSGGTQVVEISGSTVEALPGTFNDASGVAVDSAADVYVADTNDFEVRMITAQHVVTTLAGSSTQGSCTASPPLFHNPFGIAVTGSGDLYVSDYFSSQVCELTPGP
ncbi:MAG: SMP-30/gluconolactonase/LRE family protein [Steroidobacteraceae bacterium]